MLGWNVISHRCDWMMELQVRVTQWYRSWASHAGDSASAVGFDSSVVPSLFTLCLSFSPPVLFLAVGYFWTLWEHTLKDLWRRWLSQEHPFQRLPAPMMGIFLSSAYSFFTVFTSTSKCPQYAVFNRNSHCSIIITTTKSDYCHRTSHHHVATYKWNF